MKPRTKLQLRVTSLSEDLPRIKEYQKDWAYKVCLPNLAYANKSSAFCLDCGGSFSLELIKHKRATCPHCLTKVKVEHTRSTTLTERTYLAITHIVEEFQVVQNFELIANYKKGWKVEYRLQPILEDWIMPDLKVQKIGLLHNLNNYCDSWGGNWEVRKESRRSYYGKKYNVYPQYYHPDSVFKPEYTKIGINSDLAGLTLYEAIKYIPHDTKAETLLKAKQYGLLAKTLRYPGAIRQHWSSIKICLRNKYKVKDAGIWLDYLDLLTFFKKDTRNANFVCPKNLKKAHDQYVIKKQLVLARQAEERRQRKQLEDEEEFQKIKSAFFGIEFQKGNILIRSLDSVLEFKEEGEQLKHCVFTNEYYLKPETLVLSATVDGSKMETIEVNLKTFKIEQCRGKFNAETEFHSEIQKLVKSNIKVIKERKKLMQALPKRLDILQEAI